MTKENILTEPESIHSDLIVVKKLVYDKCGIGLTNLKLNPESVEYGACSYKLDEQAIQHRASKITPTKTGQFVTIWKRNREEITQPFDIEDDIDLLIITSRFGDFFGLFVFPKNILAEKGIITRNGKEGKRGIRVYPPWDIVTNKQAEKTQSWQIKYFLTITDDSIDLDLTKQLFSKFQKPT